MQDWALELLEDMQPVAEMLDCNVGEEYRQALAMQIAVAGNPELTPSARMLDELQQSGLSFIDYGLQVATINRDYFRSQAPEHNVHRPELVTEADASFARQHAIEKSDAIDFDAYIARYYS